jgi:hypothetical protein
MIRLARLCAPTIVVGLVMVFAAGSASGQGSEPLNGTWKLSRVKSSFSPDPAPLSETVRIEGIDAVRKITVDVTSATGEAQRWSVSGATGRGLPVVGANPDSDVCVLTRVNATTLEAQYLKGGKPTIKQRAVVSADGHTLTVTASGTDAQGRPVRNVAVYYK